MPRFALFLLIRVLAVAVAGLVVSSLIFGWDAILKTAKPLLWPEEKPVMILFQPSVTGEPAPVAPDAGEPVAPPAAEPTAPAPVAPAGPAPADPAPPAPAPPAAEKPAGPAAAAPAEPAPAR